jgi:hypothetical protein
MTALDEAPKAPRSLLIVFWALVAAFAALVLTVLFPDALDLFRPLFLSLTALCFLLGLALLLLSVRWKQRTLLRIFWILAGASATGFALGSVLHNAFYALATVTGKWPILNAAIEILEVVFFLIATLLCPVVFFVSTVGAIVLIVRRSGPAATVAPQSRT